MSIAAEHQIKGAALTPVDSAAAKTWLAWLTGEGPAPADAREVCFALAHSDSGVTWGYLGYDGAWRLGSAVDPQLCPIPTVGSLHELRLFGATVEVLIWRTDDSQLRGRILVDDDATVTSGDPLSPFCESRRLRIKAGEPRDGFTRYTDAGGAEHLAPMSFGPDFSVRHYLEQDPKTGAVRVVATRLLDANPTKGEKV